MAKKATTKTTKKTATKKKAFAGNQVYNDSKTAYLTVGDFAKMIHVSELTVRRWDTLHVAGKPQPKARTSRGQRLYTYAQAEKYLKGNATPSSTR